MPVLSFDIEVYPNYFLALFKDVDSGQLHKFVQSPSQPLNRASLRATLSQNTIVGFNSRNFDIPVTQLALAGGTCGELYEASKAIIERGLFSGEFREMYGLEDYKWDCIDLIEVAPLKGSLKAYAGRLHAPKMQDLPLDPHMPITFEQAKELCVYCQNDLDNTTLLYRELEGQLKLRVELGREYNLDLRSKSDAQIAEAVICSEMHNLTGMWPVKDERIPKDVQYAAPSNIQFSNPRLKLLLDELGEARFSLDGNGKPRLPDCLNAVIRIGNGAYRLGNGGLHSTEKSVYYVADSETRIIDRDVASYYPSIILNQGLYPRSMGPLCLTVYGGIVRRRLAAKKAGNKLVAESLKIAINGSFGKFGSKFSRLYSPQLLIQVTVSGQLYLLMLIDMIEESGIEVISANTDGIIIRCPRSRYDDLTDTIKAWETITGFATEETEYKALYSKDVNNYIALKPDGTSKGKGAYANPWSVKGPNIFKLHKNPVTTVCIEAVTELFDKGTPIPETIKACKDIRKFITVRSVTGGAEDARGYVGKAVRFYYGKDKGNLRYKKSGNRVPKSENAKACMALPDKLPDDLDYGWYIAECNAMLTDLGYLQRSLF